MYAPSRIPYHKKRNLRDIMENRLNILIFIIIFLFSIIVIGLIILQIGEKTTYHKKLMAATLRTVKSSSVPRGRIYDRNYNLLVDNVGRKVIYYKRVSGTTLKQEIALSYDISKVLDLPYNKLNITNLKEFWLANHSREGNNKITTKEYQQLKMHKLTNSDIQKMKIDRITAADLSIYNDQDKKAAYIHYLMHRGYSYDEKVIKDNNVTDEEYAFISENINKYKGFNTKMEWERKYLYGDTLRGLLGNVSTSNQGLPYDKKDYYLNKGYALNDRVGLNYLEYQYEDLLKGEKSEYKINSGNSFELVKQGTRGHDIVLSIDINLQQAVEQIMTEELIKAKQEPNTKYYNKSFVIISDPYTGEILTYASKQVVFKGGKYKVYDYTPFIATTPVPMGSVVKGASMSVGYKTGAINMGTKMMDECIKIASTPAKCSSISHLGILDDIKALVYSSNSYQFKTAIKVAGVHYTYNRPLSVDKSAFQTYRDTFYEYGLGVKSGIDLPLESIGYKGGSSVAGHLLDFAIGQYDTYTPVQLAEYINGIANQGSRIQLHFLKEVHKPTTSDELGGLTEKVEPVILNKINLDSKYMNRVRTGFEAVMQGPLGRGYMGDVPNPAGKTGTSESFIDTNDDGKIDKETTTKTFAGYFPSNHPIMSIVAVSPDVSYPNNRSNFVSYVNKRIASKACEKFMELYQ